MANLSAATSDSETPLISPSRGSPSLYWREKACVALLLAQMHGVLLRAVVFPPQWRMPMRWFSLACLDAPRFAAVTAAGPSTGAGLPADSFATVAAWAGTFALLVAAAIVLRARLLARAAAAMQPREALRASIDSGLLLAALLLHVPASLAFASLYAAFLPTSAAPGALPIAAVGAPAANDAVQAALLHTGVGLFGVAYRADAVVVAVLCLPSALAVCLGTPFLLLAAAARQAVHADATAHELALRRLEALYSLGLSEAWLAEAAWTTTPFRRPLGHAFDAGLWALLSGLCAWTAVTVAAFPGLQSDVVFALLALWSLRHTLFSRTFRCHSTNALLDALLVPLSATAFFGLMLAHGMQNQLTVNSTLTLILTCVNSVAASEAASAQTAPFDASLGLDEARPASPRSHVRRREMANTFVGLADLPAARGSGPAVDERMPLSSLGLGGGELPEAELAALERDAVAAMRHLLNETLRQRPRPLLLVDAAALEAARASLQRPFANLLAVRHVLAPDLAEAFDEAGSLAAAARGAASFANHILFEGPPLLLPWFRRRLDQRAREFALVSPTKARALLKLLALRAFVGARTFRPFYIPGYNDKHFLSPRFGGKAEIAGAGTGTVRADGSLVASELAADFSAADAAEALAAEAQDRRDREAFERKLDEVLSLRFFEEV